jgi:hypothetical protein
MNNQRIFFKPTEVRKMSNNSDSAALAACIAGFLLVAAEPAND